MYEWDPATGQTVGTEIPNGIFASVGNVETARPRTRLNAEDKEKVREFVMQATSHEELEEIEQLVSRLHQRDALPNRFSPPPVWAGAPVHELPTHAGGFAMHTQLPGPIDLTSTASAQSAPVAETLPPGARKLTQTGLQKVRRAIETASSLDELAKLDDALATGDTPLLQRELSLNAEDLDDESVDDEYDPFEDFTVQEEVVAPAIVEVPPASHASPSVPSAKRSLGGLLGDYHDEVDSDPEPDVPAMPAKRQKPSLAPGWAWLAYRTQRHEDFHLPTAGRTADVSVDAPNVVSLGVSFIYVGNAEQGFDARRVARVAAVSADGSPLLDLMVRSAAVLDARTHLTGLTRQAVEEAEFDLPAVQEKLLGLIGPQTLLLGYRLSSALEALGLSHSQLVDVSLLFGVESRRHQFHSVHYLAERVLGTGSGDKKAADALEVAQMVARLAQHEANQMTPTPPFPPRRGCGEELLVRHIPHAWRERVQEHLGEFCPGASLREVHWTLSETDPTDWRGEAVLAFDGEALRDRCFELLRSLVDIHVQWEDAPNAPPLGAFLTEQALLKAFSRFGVVLSARLPRKPTGEPQNFAFVSFLSSEDAEAVGRRVEVQLTPTWTLRLKTRMAKQAADKRVGVRADRDFMDWVHVLKP